VGIGIGAGIGPLRVGTGVSDREMAGCLGWLLGAAAVALLIFWPYLLGEWVAVQLGAGEGSTAAQATGWTFEAAYVVGIIALLVSTNVSSSKASRAQEAADRLASLERELAAADQQVAIATQILNVLHKSPEGVVHQSVPSTERALFIMDGVQLIEPRSTGRGGDRVPTSVATGKCLVSTHAVRFRSEQRNVEWKLSKIHSQYVGPDRVTWGVTNRQINSGVGGTPAVAELVEGLMIWANARPGTPREAIEYFDEVLARSKQRVHELKSGVSTLRAETA
jgi:hypothetical protein